MNRHSLFMRCLSQVFFIDHELPRKLKDGSKPQTELRMKLKLMVVIPAAPGHFIAGSAQHLSLARVLWRSNKAWE